MACMLFMSTCIMINADNDMQLNFVEENVIMLHVNINEFPVNITT